jgi:EAL domain-containing protein (putative c-di-GMP-specific phosphodiesterase class I)
MAGDAIHLLSQEASMESINSGHDRRANDDRRAGIPSSENAALLAALDRGEIEILFQPQFAAADGGVIGAEALVRWNHPEQVLIGGEALFEAAERAGLLGRLSRHVVGAALVAAAQWRDGLRLSLNITAADLAEAGFADMIAAALMAADFPPERLTLEITEQVLVADLDRSAERLRQLAEIGVRIALDDFGAGFCNFGYLKRLPLHYLKLDRSMVEGIDENPRDLAVLRGILAMAVALGLEVIAEGIERESQREAIVREGCAAWQGFFGARPMKGAEFVSLTVV